MDARRNDVNPQKYYVKKLCKIIYFMGLGDCWYERTEQSRMQKILYAIWATLINSFIILNTINELLAFLRTDLSVKEKNDSIQFRFAHPCLCGKYIFLVLQKHRIRALFERLLEASRSVYTVFEVEKRSVWQAKLCCLVLAASSYCTLLFTVVDAIVGYFTQGIKIRTEVVLYPTPAHSGLLINLLRLLIEVHWWCIVTNMILVDCLSSVAMVYVAHKLMIVKLYFQNLRQKVISNIGKKSDLEIQKEYEMDFITGVKLHKDALWCAKNIQYALGNVYSIQVFESITLLGMCMVKMAKIDINLTFILANGLYLVCVVIITGVYFSSAGNITYEAYEVHNAMFHSGWELAHLSPASRAVVLVAIQRSQVPVFLTAFGVVVLSHNNFISVVRASYSFFAVTY
ncbi:hypothetical protein ACJJTC_012824 [Scirpophaga incertulas]